MSETQRDRPISPHLVGMLKDTLSTHLIPEDTAADIIRDLIPLFESVDQNAHRRGMFEQRQAALGAGRD